MGFKIKLDGYAFVQSLVKAGVAATFTSFLGSTVVATPPAAAAVAVGTAAAAAAAGTADDNPIVKAISDAAGSAFKLTEGGKDMQERLAKAVEDSLEHAFASVEGDAKALMPITEKVKDAVTTAASSGYQNFGPGSDVDARAYLHAIIRHACDASHDGSLMGEEVQERIVSVFFETLGQNMLKDDLLGRKFLMEVINAHNDAMLQAVAEVYAKVDALQEMAARILGQLQQLGDGSSQGDRDTELLSRIGTVMRQVLDEHARQASASAPKSDIQGLLTRCGDRLAKQRDNHPSFKLMRDGFSSGILPKGADDAGPAPIPNRGRLVRPDGGDPVPFRDFVRESWASEGQQHLLVTGRGGIGKTVAMLTFATEEGFLKEGVPTAYVPLYDLSHYHGDELRCIDRYLEDNFSPEDCDSIRRLSNEPWDGNPNVLLLLDGYNEVPPKRRTGVDQGIRAWAERAGTQLVTTSRVPCLASPSNVRRLELLPLSAEEARSYLAGRGMKAPADGDARLWQALETPLMLKIFADVDDLPNKLGAPYLRLAKPDSAGHLMWNYLQRELWRAVDHNRAGREGAERAAAVLLTLPYVCWRMESAHEFTIGEDGLREYVRDACARWRDEGSRPEGFSDVEESLDSFVDDMTARRFASAQLSILANETGLLARNGDGYSLLHQSLRDGFAAIHLKNVMEASSSDLPDEYKRPVSEYVKDFVADVCAEEPLLGLWETNRRNLPTDAAATHNLLRIVHARHDGDLGSLSFTGMNLRGISLRPYKKPGTEALTVAHDATRFRDTLLDTECFNPQGSRGAINSICFTPNGSMFITASADGIIRLWDTRVHECLAKLDNGNSIRSVCVSPDGDTLASGSCDGILKVWDVHKHVCVRQVASGRIVGSVSFAPDGHHLTTVTEDGIVQVWSAQTHGQISVLPTDHGALASACISSDGTLIVTATRDGVVRVTDLSGGTCIAEEKCGLLEVRSVCFSPDSNLIAVTTRGEVEVRESRTLAPVKKYESNLVNASACFSPDGLLFATCCEYGGSVRIWNRRTGRDVTIPESYVTPDTCLSFSPDGDLLAVGALDGSVRLYSPLTLESRATLIGPCVTSSACFNRDGTALAFGSSDGIVRLCDTRTHELNAVLKTGGFGAGHVRFLPDGRLLAACFLDTHVHICDVGERGDEQEVETSELGSFECLSPDGRLMALSSIGGQIHIVGTSDQRPAASLPSKTILPVTSAQFSPDARHIVTSHFLNRSVRLWDAGTGYCLHKFEGSISGWVSCVSFSPDGEMIASGSTDGLVRLWNVRSEERLKEFDYGGDEIHSVAFSPDGRVLASGSKHGRLRLWEVGSDEVTELVGHEGPINSVCFSLDAKLVATTSDDGTLRLWDTSDHKLEATIRPIFGIDLHGVDLSLAAMPEDDREVFRQNGVRIPPSGSMERVSPAAGKSDTARAGDGDNHRSCLQSFRVALTFTETYRDSFARPVCKALLGMGYAKDDVFLDEWHEPLFSGIGADTKLQEIYHDRCDVVAVLLSPDYAECDWTGHVQWRAVRDLINKGHADKVCLLRTGGVDVSSFDGLFPTSDIAMDVDGKTPERIAQDIDSWIGLHTNACER